MRLPALLVCTALALSLPQLAHADEVVRPDAGNLSLSLGIPSGGNDYAAGAAGLWWMLSDRLNLGFNVGLGFDFDDDTRDYEMILAPTLRFYLTEGGQIAPFILGQVSLQVFENDFEDMDAGFGFTGGLGAELWVLSELSIAGHVGMGFLLYDGRGSSARVGTFTSGLTANLYFDL